jgi:hypothetical protein
MKGTHLAEWLLCRVTTPAHASARVGDLLELSQTRGTLWFWRAVLSNVAFGGYRFMRAFVLAFSFSQVMAILWDHGGFGNQPDMNSVYTTGMLILAPLCIVPIFLLLRLGWRDAHVHFSLLFGFAGAVSVACYSHQVLRWMFPAVCIVSLVLARTRRVQVPLQSLAQLGFAVAISAGSLILFLVTLISLWAVVFYLFNRPETFFHFAMTLSAHPVHDLINAPACLLIVVSANRMQNAWGTPRTI